ncbi:MULTISPECIES: adaptor protein MecA [unclassified Bacillus (in: firmicutes)]|uniref:adaptor protein MecA n=1 Tax=unclassified Bacillus (in: firmicutes) TaxID=185979 RepID=UPI0008E235DF|nr:MULTISPECIES: adaptor protein MecA [unclassified Bacillus (in: firmicutes)]SFA98190.1 adapter protein MecA 1/2 [Bacillus sp. UNCCL13]SFQ80879.1 adapter protein MecA 1/2 [Bacillus sp. cl95]
MRLERLTMNKIKIFLSSDDLLERGLSKEDIWKDSIKWHQLFHDMVEEACEEFDVDIQGSVAVEIFSQQAQGMILILTMEEVADGEEVLFDGFIEMQVSVEEYDSTIYVFETFEDCIQLSKRLHTMGINGGSLISRDNKYYLIFSLVELLDLELTTSILSEYGNPCLTSEHVLSEYGNTIIDKKAVETILQFFK